MSVAVQMDYGHDIGEPEQQVTWFDICAVDDIPLDCGAAALIGGRQVALVRVACTSDATDATPQIFALSNYDPFSEAFVIARGIVGDREGRPKIASPIYKQSFDLRTGVCFDDPTVSLSTYPVRVSGNRIEVGLEYEAGSAGQSR